MVGSASECEEEMDKQIGIWCSLCLDSSSAYLMCLIEEQAEVGKDHPELLPAITVLELSQQIS